MTKLMEDTCATCRFYRPSDEYDEYGRCYRYPNTYPKSADSFCGEHQLPLDEVVAAAQEIIAATETQQ